MDFWFMIALLMIMLWIIGMIIAYKKNLIKGAFSLFGPCLMWKTEKGKKFIGRVAKYKFWNGYGDFAILLAIVGLIFTFFLMLWQATLVVYIPKESAPSPIKAIGLPGINPVIPLWYGLIGLVVAVLFHELSHGLLMARSKLEIKSLGVLFFIFPIGAFVEPDEEKLMQGDRRKRMRIFAAGPTTNLLIAALTFLLFAPILMGNVSPIYDGMAITSTYDDTPNPELINGMEIISLNDTDLSTVDDILNINIMPLENISTQVFYMGELSVVEVISGMAIVNVIETYPADNAGISEGMIIENMNNQTIRNYGDYSSVLDNTSAGDVINITLFENVNDTWTERNFSIILADKYEYYKGKYPQFEGKGFVGIEAHYLGVNLQDVDDYLEILAHPISSLDIEDMFYDGLVYIALPFFGMVPVSSPISDLYQTPLPADIFWPLANALYWIFWLNLMLGLFNLLPAKPLDGGYLFNDWIQIILEKCKVKKNREKIASSITTFTSFLILFLILWQFIGPYLF